MKSAVRRVAALAAALLLAPAAGAAAPSRHPFGIDDWAATRSASAVAVAPDGRTVLYRLTRGAAKGADVVTYRLVGADGGGDRALPVPKGFHPLGFVSPATIYGTAKRGETDQLATLALAGTRPRPLTRLPGGVNGAVLSPDGRRFAVLADPSAPDPLGEVHDVQRNEAQSVYVVDVDGGRGAWWCPQRTWVGGVAWSRDGARLAVLSQTPRIGWRSVRGWIDVCNAHGARRIAAIGNAVINEIPFPGAGIAWTRDERGIAFLSTTSDTLTPDHVYTVRVADGAVQDATPALQGSALALRGTPTGAILVLVARGVREEIDRFTPDGLVPWLRVPEGTVGLPVTADTPASPVVIANVADPAHPTDVARVTGDGSLRRLTAVDDAELATLALGRVERHRWTSADGVALEAIVTFPAGWDGRPGRFVVLPHGGPESNDTLRLDTLARLVAGAGYVVMQPEYRGSTGYGTAHLQAIYGRFGDTAYRDVDAATTEAVARGWADPRRLAIFGWSAGGFMTSWTITQTDRYRAAVEGAGITDWLSFMDASDVQQIDYNATPTTDPGPFLRYSAMQHVDAVRTPLLILHGEADQRVPFYEGKEYFNALAERGKTVRMVGYPGSGHFPTRWDQRRDIGRELLGWLRRYDP